MQINIVLAVLLVTLIIGITVLIGIGSTVPTEFLVLFSSLATAIVGIITRNPINNNKDT